MNSVRRRSKDVAKMNTLIPQGIIAVFHDIAEISPFGLLPERLR